MERARIVKFCDVRVGDIVCKRLNDLLIDHAYKVLEIGASEDRKGKLVSLRLQPPNQSWLPHWLNSDPDDRIILVHRPWTKGKTEQDMIRRIDDALPSDGLTSDGTARRIHQNLAHFLPGLRAAMDVYELGKPLEK